MDSQGFKKSSKEDRQRLAGSFLSRWSEAGNDLIVMTRRMLHDNLNGDDPEVPLVLKQGNSLVAFEKVIAILGAEAKGHEYAMPSAEEFQQVELILNGMHQTYIGMRERANPDNVGSQQEAERYGKNKMGNLLKTMMPRTEDYHDHVKSVQDYAEMSMDYQKVMQAYQMRSRLAGGGAEKIS